MFIFPPNFPPLLFLYGALKGAGKWFDWHYRECMGAILAFLWSWAQASFQFQSIFSSCLQSALCYPNQLLEKQCSFSGGFHRSSLRFPCRLFVFLCLRTSREQSITGWCKETQTAARTFDTPIKTKLGTCLHSHHHCQIQPWVILARVQGKPQQHSQPF